MAVLPKILTLEPLSYSFLYTGPFLFLISICCKCDYNIGSSGQELASLTEEEESDSEAFWHMGSTLVFLSAMTRVYE